MKQTKELPYLFDRPLMGKILVLSRSGAARFVYDKPWACISIATEPTAFPKINAVQRIDLLRLEFSDLEFPVTDFNPEDFSYAVDLLGVDIKIRKQRALTRMREQHLKDMGYSADEANRKLFNEAHAEQILTFVKKVWDDIDILMIHCYAGISRSSAVAKALSEIYQGDQYNQFFDTLYTPNQLVYIMLKKMPI